MDSTFKVGDIIAAHKDIISGDDYGNWLCAKAGEHLVVYKHLRGTMHEVHLARSPSTTDQKFWIREAEVDLVRAIDEDRTNLAYVLHATPWHYGSLDKAWDKVAQILKEFKKRKHAGFYFDVEELSRGRGYMIKVYRAASVNRRTMSQPMDKEKHHGSYQN